jgi:hypothetical protein
MNPIQSIQSAVRRILQRIKPRCKPHHISTRVLLGMPTDASGAFTSLDEATSAKEFLKTRLSGMPWLRGIGITVGPEGYAVKVNVERESDRSFVPLEVLGTLVYSHAVGNIVALSAGVANMTSTTRKRIQVPATS